ncbi:DUF6069 family protein [Amycolatopsis pigmentata]|uniref:DUF6069 family protein n=1 Tax=Amycolatopsis pigmentata TaxID=450801 RepID=A0ABW5FNJ1_9PSEU
MESREIDPGRLWAGGALVALVAALVAVAGLLVARGLFGVAVLAPKGRGIWGNANTLTYALVAAAAALAAMGLMHLLLVAAPAPEQFFGWIMALVTLIAAVLPLTLTVDTAAKWATALINIAIGAVIAFLVSTVAGNAYRPRTPPPPPPDDTLQYPESPYYRE